MARMSRGGLVLAGLLFLVGSAAARADAPVSAGLDFVPDPASVVRHGPAYRYPQAGWIVLHIEGEPYDRGYQHGRLLSSEIAAYVKAMASMRSPKAPGDAWRGVRTLVDAVFLRRYDPELLEEMKGIADGAAAAGGRFENRPLDLVDIVAANSDMELACLEGALGATATGLEEKRFREEPDRTPAPEHCSAFAAVGPATQDGKIVFGHITMFNLYMVRHYNVWLDIKPSHGHRVLMQTYPGGIQSGMDYYMNDAGLLVAETTIKQTKFDIDGRALASRIRKALQYSESIDGAVRFLSEQNNGLYTNEWLLADLNANEIAMFELGTQKTKLWRSGKNEWLAGAEGFYWGCNNTKDLDVRLETLPSLGGRPANAVFRPADRDKVWLALYDEFQGKINSDFGFLAFTKPPLAAFSSCDAKFTTTDMARELKTFALFGPPLGRTWDPSPSESARLADIKPLVSNDWTVLRATPPPLQSGEKPKVVDLAARRDGNAGRDRSEDSGDLNPDLSQSTRAERVAAWRGTILPAADSDTWLAAAFADFEPIAGLEKSLSDQPKGRSTPEDDRDRLEVALYAPKSAYLTAVKRLGADMPLAETRADWKRDEWYQIAAGKGTLLLSALRKLVGVDRFAELMDQFGRAHAGKPVSTADFRAHFEEGAKGKPVAALFDTWLKGKGLPATFPGGTWSINSFEAEPEKALIVYGTRKDSAAQREAAERLQRAIQRHWSNVTVPIKAESDASQDDLASHHLLLIGRPETNGVTRRLAEALPVAFGPASFVVRGQTYAHSASAVIAAGSNPLGDRYSVVVFAGLSAEATWRCAEEPGRRGDQTAEVLILPATGRPHRLVVPPREKPSPVALDARP